MEGLSTFPDSPDVGVCSSCDPGGNRIVPINLCSGLFICIRYLLKPDFLNQAPVYPEPTLLSACCAHILGREFQVHCVFTSKPLPRREASIPKAVGESSPELGTPDVALLEHTVPTRPTPPPSQSAACWCPLLLPLLPGSPRTSHSCPRSAAVLPTMEAHTSVLPRAWGGEGRELLVLGRGSYQVVGPR